MFVEAFLSAQFWVAVGQIVMIDILLGGDNAVVIALACRSLPPAQRTKGIIWGTAGAIVLRVILIFFALALLQIPFLKLVGAALLLWIGVKLLQPEHEGGGGHGDVAASDKLWGAVKTVIIADLVMSLDNVIAIAGAAESAGGDHTMPLVIFGLVVSIPIIVWGSQLVLKLMDRFPMVITIGGMLLGWIAGTMAVTDPAVASWVPMSEGAKPEALASVRYGAGIAGALLVLLAGKWMAARVPVRVAVSLPAAAAAAPLRLQRVLVAVDGSEASGVALRRALSLRETLRHGDALDMHLVNVQRPLSGDVSLFIPGKTLDDYHRENSDKVLSAAREALGSAAGSVHEHRFVGDPGPTIAECASQLGADLIVMGARGLGSHTAGLLGSVTQATIAHAGVPVLVVK